MRMSSISLAAALMLGSVAGAYAQGGPPDEKEMPAPSQSREGPQGEPSAQGDEKGAQQAEPKGQSQARKEGQAYEKSAEPGNQGRQAREGMKEEGRQAREGMKEDQKSAAPSKEGDTSKQAQPSKQGEPSKQVEPKGDASNKAAESKDSEPSKQTQTESTDPNKKPQAADRNSPEQAKQVQLTGEKADKVRSAFSSVNVKQESNINVNISIGSRLPSTLHFHPVPVAVAELVPEYRDFVFIMVEGRFVIVEPRTYEIVTIIDAPQRIAGGGGGGERSCESSLTLSAEERDFILKSVQFTGDVDASGVTIGWRVPESVQLMPFPEPVLARTAKLKSCRYFVVEDQIAIVDPDEDKVVMLLDDED